MKKKDEVTVKPVKTKQLQLSEPEFLKIQLYQSQLENLNMQSIAIQNQITSVINDFCKKVSEKPENIVCDPYGRIFLDKDGKLTFKEK